MEQGIKMTRREFFRLASAAGAGLAGGGCSGIGGSQSRVVNTVFSPEDLALMFLNAKRYQRPEAPCPLGRSKSIRGVKFTGRQRDYRQMTGADTFITSWAADGQLYSTYADGFVQDAAGNKITAICTLQSNHWYFRNLGVHSPLERPGDAANPPIFERTGGPGHVTHTGNAIISGDDPFDLKIRALAPTPLRHAAYPSFYPSGCLMRDGVWITAGHYRAWSLTGDNRQLCYEQGPNRFRISWDHGRSWSWSEFDDRRPLMTEAGRPAGGPPVRLGTAKFVDFGQNMRYSPDGLAYLVGHGTEDPQGISNWSSGDAMYLARFPATAESLNTPRGFEYFAGIGSQGKPIWSRSFAKIRPVFQWPGRCGLPSVTYFPEIRKYIGVFCVGWPDGVDGQYDTWIGEADALWGPWSMIQYWDAFADQCYFAQIPSKFIRPEGKFSLFYSGGWAGVKPLPASWKKKPSIPELPAATYSLCVAEFQLEL